MTKQFWSIFLRQETNELKKKERKSCNILLLFVALVTNKATDDHVTQIAYSGPEVKLIRNC